jgi:hypothetical protein
LPRDPAVLVDIAWVEGASAFNANKDTLFVPKNQSKTAVRVA